MRTRTTAPGLLAALLAGLTLASALPAAAIAEAGGEASSTSAPASSLEAAEGGLPQSDAAPPADAAEPGPADATETADAAEPPGSPEQLGPLEQWGAIPGDAKSEWEANLSRAREFERLTGALEPEGRLFARSYSSGSLADSIIPNFAPNGLTERELDSSWFAYTREGETLNMHLWAYLRGQSNPPEYRAKVTLTSPAGVSETREIERGAAAPQFTETDTPEGVWKITITDIVIGEPYTRDLTPADFNVRSADGSVQSGRVWSERVAVDQTSLQSPTLYAMSPTGVIYRVTMPQYDGVSSTWTMNNIGIHAGAPGAPCVQARRSLPEAPAIGADSALNPDGWYAPSTPADCSGLTAYRLFPEMPSKDIPEQIETWADAVSRPASERWGRPEYAAPGITKMRAVRLEAGTSRTRITGELNGQGGTVRGFVDLDADGTHDRGAEPGFEIVMNRPGEFRYDWDGRDATGSAIPPTREARVFLRVDNVAPIHFVREDAERSGGLEIEAVQGGAPGHLNLNWDDSAFTSTSSERLSTVSAWTGEDASSQGGVHGWNYADAPWNNTLNEAGRASANSNTGTGGSHGDRRMINDWAFIRASTEYDDGLPLPVDPELKIDKVQIGEPRYAEDRRSAEIEWEIRVRNTATSTRADATGVRVDDVLPLGAERVEQVRASQGAFDVQTAVWHVGTLEHNNSDGT